MKRLTVAAIITVVAAGVFTGCGNAGTTQMNSATGTTAESQNSQDAGTQSSAQSDDQNAAGTTDQTGSNSGTQDIGEDAALQAALEAAGVSESDASRLRISKDRDDGRVVYEIRFDVDQTEYDYDVLASDGQILSSDVELRNDDGDDDDDRNRGSNADVAISREEAIDIALAKVSGATESDIRIELDHDDGRYKYEGDIIYERVEYDFEIDANSGDVLEWSEERE
ncbi:PepSY domain-containing protein [Mediterraneibacter glycyrrhizinilyticus]|uniref:PepSY domain-containing protein n=1 Tax=Mediterraneibacter glycyrrhizinilyticus TaxID=342942 RepID=UPI0025AA4E76|nr:PepSY domain-containing protein [Mediterraneibacter glycyrrhizinilyticus]MDN0044244.1 PepSY domain-containing protein [Mediterraneibacter glycyrrhizinilyticus]